MCSWPWRPGTKEMDCADRAVGLIRTTGWLCVLVVEPQGQHKSWKEVGHGGKNLLSLSGMWSQGQGTGVWEAKGLWALGWDWREFALGVNAKGYGSMRTHSPIPQASILFPLLNHHEHSAETSMRHSAWCSETEWQHRGADITNFPTFTTKTS